MNRPLGFLDAMIFAITIDLGLFLLVRYLHVVLL